MKMPASKTNPRTKTTAPKVEKFTFRQQLEKRQADLEEMRIRTEQIMELRNILSQTIEDETAPSFGSNEYQKRIPILTEEERAIVKDTMLNIIKEYFK
jgi:hypothetical protein